MKKLPEFVWCIEHAEMVKLENGACVGHVYATQGEFGIEIDFCCMEKGYAFVPPPAALFSDDLDYARSEDWKKWCEDNAPDEDEQAEMDAYPLPEEVW